MLISTHLGDAL